MHSHLMATKAQHFCYTKTCALFELSKLYVDAGFRPKPFLFGFIVGFSKCPPVKILYVVKITLYIQNLNAVKTLFMSTIIYLTK